MNDQWQIVGQFADCDIYGKGNERQLIERKSGRVVANYEVPEWKDGQGKVRTESNENA